MPRLSSLSLYFFCQNLFLRWDNLDNIVIRNINRSASQSSFTFYIFNDNTDDITSNISTIMDISSIICDSYECKTSSDPDINRNAKLFILTNSNIEYATLTLMVCWEILISTRLYQNNDAIEKNPFVVSIFIFCWMINMGVKFLQRGQKLIIICRKLNLNARHDIDNTVIWKK